MLDLLGPGTQRGTDFQGYWPLNQFERRESTLMGGCDMIRRQCRLHLIYCACSCLGSVKETHGALLTQQAFQAGELALNLQRHETRVNLCLCVCPCLSRPPYCLIRALPFHGARPRDDERPRHRPAGGPHRAPFWALCSRFCCNLRFSIVFHFSVVLTPCVPLVCLSGLRGLRTRWDLYRLDIGQRQRR